MDCPRRPQSISYVAFKIFFAALDVAVGTGGHINADATFRTKCGRPHLVREIRTLGSMSGDGKRGVAAWPKLPRPSSTLPFLPFGVRVWYLSPKC